jgi:predicted RNase H-like HicB family nuclease
MKKKIKKRIVAFGYIKEEEGIYTAICVNMGLFGQGKTPDEAVEKVKKAVVSYVKFVLAKHPDECEKFLNRPAPVNLINEFVQSIKNPKESKTSTSCLLKQSHIFIPNNYFAEAISFAQA